MARSPATLGRPADPADRAATPHGPHPRPPAASSSLPAVRDGLHDRRRGAAWPRSRLSASSRVTGDKEGPVAHGPCLRRTSVSSAWRRFRTATSTACGCGAGPGTRGPRFGRPVRRRRRSGSGADPGRRVGRASCASTPSTAATVTELGAYVINMVDALTQSSNERRAADHRALHGSRARSARRRVPG